jgi:hypothetical protein
MSKQNEFLSDHELLCKLVEDTAAIRKFLEKGLSVHHASLDLLDNSDMKRIFKASDSTLKTWRDEELPFYQVVQKIYYRVSEVEAFLQQRKGGAMRKVHGPAPEFPEVLEGLEG